MSEQIYDYNIWLDPKFNDKGEITAYDQRLTIYPVTIGADGDRHTNHDEFQSTVLSILPVEEVDAGEAFDEWWCDSYTLDEEDLPESILTQIKSITKQYEQGARTSHPTRTNQATRDTTYTKHRGNADPTDDK